MKKAEEEIRSIFLGLKKPTLQSESMTKTQSGQDFKWCSSAVLSEYLHVIMLHLCRLGDWEHCKCYEDTKEETTPTSLAVTTSGIPARPEVAH